MEVSPFLQEIPVSRLAAAVEEAFPVDVSGDTFRKLTANDIVRLFNTRVQLSTAKHRTSGWESAHSLIVQIFKDRRGKVVRACKSAFSHVIDLAKLSSADEGAQGSAKKKTGGFACPPNSKKSVRHSNLGSVRPISVSKDTTFVDDSHEISQFRHSVRVVHRGFPEIIIEESTGEEESDTVWVVSILKLTLTEFKSRYSFYAASDVSDYHWDFPDHPIFLPYYAAVCNDLNVRTVVPSQTIGPIDSNGGNNAKYRSVANVTLNSHGSVIEVSGPCAKFEAFIASQV